MRNGNQANHMANGVSLEKIESKIEFDCGWEWSWYAGGFVYQCDGVPVPPPPGVPPQPEHPGHEF